MDTTNLPKTRQEAMATGAKYYFTGEPCKHGHIAPRKTKGSCVECLKVEWEKANVTRADYYREYNKSDAGQKAKRKYYEANKERIKEYHKEWRQANKERIKEQKRQKTTCGCGSEYTKRNKTKHERTKKHQKWLKNLETSI